MFVQRLQNICNFRLSHQLLVQMLLVLSSICLLFTSSLHAQGFDPFEQLQQQPSGTALYDIYKLSANDPEAAGIQLQQLDEVISFTPSLHYQMVRLIILERLAESRAQPDKAADYVEQMFALGNATKENWVVAHALYYQAVMAIKQTENETSFKLVNQALELAKQSDYSLLIARLLNTRGALYTMQGKTAKAQEDYLSALSYLADYPQELLVLKVISNIAVIYMQYEDWDKALEYVQRALKSYLASGGKSHQRLTILYLHHSRIYDKLNQLEKAKEFQIKANSHALKSGLPHLMASSLSHDARLQFKTGRIEESMAIADKCLRMTKEHNILIAQAYCYRVHALVRLRQKKANEALYYLQRSSKLFHVADRKAHVSNKQYLSAAYELKGDLTKALHYARRFNELNTAMLFDKRQQQLYRLQETHDAEARENEIALLSAENALKASRLEQQQLKENLWALLLLVGLLVVAWIIQKYRQIHVRNARLARSNQQLYQHSYLDPLTSLNNRRYLEKHIQKLPKGKNAVYLVVVLDIDHFKKINDNYGHDVGDEILRQIGQTLKKHVTKNDICVRWGGEEFVCLKRVQTPQDLNWAEQVRQQIARHEFLYEQMKFSITLSAGVYPAINAEGLIEHWDAIFKQADKALYQAKQAGRNHICFAPSDHL